MKIRYFGHSCFFLAFDCGTSVLTDPYSGIGFELPKGISSDVVSVSHDHFDHNYSAAVSGNPFVLNCAGEYQIGDVKIKAIPCFHDEVQGKKRGKNLVFKFEADGITVCHLGDLGEPCTAELASKIGSVDILLIPVGGVYTIDSREAKRYVDAVKPAVIVPMHYKTEGLTVNVGKVDDFLARFKKNGVSCVKCGCEAELDRTDLSDHTPKIIVMERCKIWK